jgi:hypothetical protein
MARKKKDLTDGMPKFQMPPNLIDQLYELSGNADKYKGVVFAYLSEDGTPLIYAKYDSQVIEFGMRKALEKYLESSDMNEMTINGDESFGEEGLDEEE